MSVPYLYPEDCFEGLAAWPCLTGRGAKQAVNRSSVIPPYPGSSTWFFAALCSKAEASFPFFLCQLQWDLSQLHGCSQPTAAKLHSPEWRAGYLHAGSLPWLSGTPTLSQGLDLSTKPLKLLQFSMPLHSLCWPSWFEKRTEVAWAAAPHGVTPSTAFPRKCPRSIINTEPSKSLLKPSADVFWTQIEASPPASEDQDYEVVLEALLTQLLLLRAVLSVQNVPGAVKHLQQSIQSVLPAKEVSPSHGSRLLAAVPQPVSSQGLSHALGSCWVSLCCWGGFAWAGASQEGGRAWARGSRVTCGKRPAVPSREGHQDQAAQTNSSDQPRQCWTPSRHSLLGMQEQNWKCTGAQLHQSCPHGGQAATGKVRKQGTEMLLLHWPPPSFPPWVKSFHPPAEMPLVTPLWLWAHQSRDWLGAAWGKTTRVWHCSDLRSREAILGGTTTCNCFFFSSPEPWEWLRNKSAAHFSETQLPPSLEIHPFADQLPKASLNGYC